MGGPPKPEYELTGELGDLGDLGDLGVGGRVSSHLQIFADSSASRMICDIDYQEDTLSP
jgi:hypothetical protein